MKKNFFVDNVSYCLSIGSSRQCKCQVFWFSNLEASNIKLALRKYLSLKPDANVSLTCKIISINRQKLNHSKSFLPCDLLTVVENDGFTGNCLFHVPPFKWPSTIHALELGWFMAYHPLFLGTAGSHLGFFKPLSISIWFMAAQWAFGHQGIPFCQKGFPLGTQGLTFCHQGLPFAPRSSLQSPRSSLGSLIKVWQHILYIHMMWNRMC